MIFLKGYLFFIFSLLTIHLFGDSSLRIVTTTGMIGDLVKNVVRGRAEVEVLMGSGTDPHLYQPSRYDLVALSKADIIFFNGLYLEGKLSKILLKIDQAEKRSVAVAEKAKEKIGDQFILTKDGYDPHLWMDVSAWIVVLQVIEDKLSARDRANREFYKDNALQYRENLLKLDQYAKDVLGSIPERQRILITAHDAFGYLGRAYGIEVKGIQGMSTESEAGLYQIEELVRFVVDQKVSAIFVESSVSQKNVRALIEGAHAKGHVLRMGGELFSDAMGSEGTYQGTYIGMIDHNVTTISRALGGTAPAKGFSGILSLK